MVPSRRSEDLNPAGGPVRNLELRLFYALWPDARLRQSLAAATAGAVRLAGGRPVPASNYHLTLAFLGRVDGRATAELIAAGGQVQGDAVDCRFDRIEYWPRPRVLVASATAIPSAGQALVEQLWQQLAPLGFARESRPWQPHLTLARRVPRPPPAFGHEGGAPGSRIALTARFHGLALVESVSAPRGARYRPIAEWPLGRGLSHLPPDTGAVRK